eukprot:TRINITY_DN7347_c0_g1_i1.p1 TRINITY_DN7347_c0_g1~~TRINITY_DN7347_c0_g1_i1.p1  ORF type:complete len:453 (+),score=70.82 TRINITY_DN7347_c0_g1_i1:138-1496(+)
MSSSDKMNPHRLGSALASLYFPETPSGPYRNRQSLFIPEEKRPRSPPADTQVTPTRQTNKSASKKSKSAKKTPVTSSSIAIPSDNPVTTDTTATSSLTSALGNISFSDIEDNGNLDVRTPALKRSYSRFSWNTYTDPVQRRTTSITFHSNKKRRVSFKPSLEVTEYYSGGPNDPYSLPLNDGSPANDSIPPRVPDDSLCRDVLAPDKGHSPKDLSSSLLSRRAPTDLDLGQDIQNSVLVEFCPKVAVDLNTTYDCEDSPAVDSSLVLPREVQESLVELMSQKQNTRDPNKSVITHYAPLHTSTSFSPVKVKLAFPPLSLDPLHSSLNYQRNKELKSTKSIKVSIDKDNAILPISFFKTWYYKNANSRFLPASTSIWLQDYSTNLIEHFIKLVRTRCLRNSGARGGYCTATPSDVVAVIKEYLELDDNININNLIHTYLPMELWFSYDPSLEP